MVNSLLLNVPTLLLGIGVVAFSVAIAIGGVLLVRRSVELRTLESHHEVAGFILAVVGVVYAVLLAFVAVVVWEQYDRAQDTANQEATAIGSAYRDAVTLGNKGAPVRLALQRYAESVVDPEWDHMAEFHEGSGETDEALNRVWRSFDEARAPANQGSAFMHQAIRVLHDATELRETRIDESDDKIPSPVWAVLIVGAFITVGFTYFFGVKNLGAQLLMVGALSSLIGLTMFLILALDLPFTGGVAVDQSAMREAIHEFPAGD
jgi:hypothetical protein